MLMETAYFDIDQTIVAGRTHLAVLAYFWRKRWVKIRHLPGLAWAGLSYQIGFLMGRPNLPKLMNRFYSFVAGRTVHDFEKEIFQLFEEKVKKMILEEARREVDSHLAAGRAVVLVSTALSGLAKLIGQELRADHVIASRLEVKDGRLTGRFERIVFGPQKLVEVGSLKEDLSQDYFYTDCFSDEPLLRAVGFPRPVNPDWRLKKLAEKENWPIHYWRN